MKTLLPGNHRSQPSLEGKKLLKLFIPNPKFPLKNVFLIHPSKQTTAKFPFFFLLRHPQQKKRINEKFGLIHIICSWNFGFNSLANIPSPKEGESLIEQQVCPSLCWTTNIGQEIHNSHHDFPSLSCPYGGDRDEEKEGGDSGLCSQNVWTPKSIRRCWSHSRTA